MAIRKNLPIRFFLLIIPAVLCIGLLVMLPSAAGASELKAILIRELASRKSSGQASPYGTGFPYRKDVDSFYQARGYAPAWTNHGNPVSGAWQLLDAARNSDRQGLEPSDYHPQSIDSLLALCKRRFFRRAALEPKAAVDLDLILTETYFMLANHLLTGRIRPKALEDGWHISREDVDLPAHLDKTLSEGRDVRVSLQQLAPQEDEYGKLKYWLETYRRIEAIGGWPRIPEGPPLGPKSAGPRVVLLCQRLQAEGYAGPGKCPETLTPALEEALKRFQATHGLDADGTAETATVHQLNISVKERIDRIKVGLDCWRWLPRDLGRRHIRVNIADFRLGAFEDGREVLSMRVVVGRKEDSTPVFSDRAVAVSLNPSWNVPASIARSEMLPELKKDPDYLSKHDMELLSDWSDGAKALRADSIDWSHMDSAGFRFRIRQKNGDASALGRVKIVLTNPFNIYLHDTPSKGYFDRDKRALSHGCVRLQDPIGLAEWLLGPDRTWTRDSLQAEIDKDSSVYLPIPGHGIPVHILYWTAFVDNAGGLQFRSDVYGWDKRLEAELVAKTKVR